MGGFGTLDWEVLVVDGVVSALPAKEHVALYVFSIVAMAQRADISVQLSMPSRPFSYYMGITPGLHVCSRAIALFAAGLEEWRESMMYHEPSIAATGNRREGRLQKSGKGEM